MATYMNIVIILVFIYLLLAMMITGINEAFFNYTRKRAQYLKFALENLFFDDEWKKIVTEVVSSPFIRTLEKKKDLFPSTIPAESFTSALLSTIGNGQTDFAVVRNNIMQNKDKGDLYRLLYAIVSNPEINAEGLRKEIDKIFNNAMDRVTSWYTRFAKLLSLVLAVFIAFFLNIDTIHITSVLYKDRDMTEKLATFAVMAQKTIEKGNSDTIHLTDKTNELVRITFTPKQNKKSGRASSDTNPGNNLLSGIPGSDSTQSASQSYKIFAEMGIPMGWNKNNMPPADSGFWDCFLGWFLKIFGILLTGFATSLGAPFWFDILTKISPLKKVPNANTAK